MDPTCEILTLEEIVIINTAMCRDYGGFHDGGDNFLNRGSLEYILDAIHECFFGVEPYPTIPEKAAAVGWTIAAGHIFHDANKRTGLEVCRQLLELNGYTLEMDQDGIDTILKVADGKMDTAEFAEWILSRI